jgi:hypothetical protein
LRGAGAWTAAPADAVTSVFPRTGAVVAASGDYSAFYAPTVHTHAAADITSGVIAVARLGTGTPSSSNYLRGDGAWTAAPVASVFGRTGAVVAVATDYTPAFIGAAAASHVHAAADITTGVMAVARLGTGTPSSSNFLRGDGSWQVPAGGGSQTPWTSNIDAATFALTNAGRVDPASSVTFDPSWNYAGVVIREPGRGGYSGGGPNYAPRFALYWQGTNGAQIAMLSDGTVCIWDVNGTAYAPLACSTLSPKNLPSAAPAAGSKQLWYDPADSNRVKYVP